MFSPVSTRSTLRHHAFASILFVSVMICVASVVRADHCIDYATQTLHVEATLDFQGGKHVTVDGNRAYTSGQGLRIYDITNPVAAVFLGSLSSLPYDDGAIQVAGDFAYLAGWIALAIFDVSNPAAISLRGNAPISGPTSVVLHANYAYVGGSGGVSVVDVTQPDSPAVVGTLTGMNVADVVVRDGRLYVSSGVGLRLYDLANPAAPVLLGSLDATTAGVVDLDVAAGLAFTASRDGFRVIDVSNPSVPAAMAFLPWDSYSFYYDLIADGDRVYVTHQHEAYWSMVDLYDVSQPNLPAHVGSCRLPDSANPIMGLTLAGGYVFAVGARFWVIDVVPAQRSAEPIGFVDTPGNALNVAVSGTHAFVADETSLQIVDLAVPSAPRIIGSLPLAAKLVSAQGNLLLVGGTARTLVDISDPSQPSIIGNLPGTSATDVELVGNRAFVCNGGPFEIYDVTNPAAPVPAGTLGNGVTSLEVEGNYAYVNLNGGTVTVVDISGSAPSIVATIGTTTLASLDVAGEYLYLGKGGGGHQLTSLYDIKDPIAPVNEGYFEARVKMVAGDEDVFYAIAPRVAGSGFAELVILSVHDPGWWNSLGVLPLADFAHAVHVASGYVFVAEGASGVYIYPKYCTATDAGEFTTASRLRLLPAWPNPAHEITNWKLDLPGAATVRLEVFDVGGRRVRSVWNGPLAGGRHVLEWDGRDDLRRPVASGVYLVRVVTPSGEARSRVSWTR